MKVRVGTYNARNFFDRKQIGEYDKPKRKDEIDAMVKVLNALGADIIAFQEVESQKALGRMNDRLKKPYEYVLLVPGNYYRGLHLGFMSRYPFTTLSHWDAKLSAEDGASLRDYADPDAASPTRLRFQRDVLLGEFQFGTQKTLSIFNLHLKSHSTSDWRLLSNDGIRAAEAREARRIISAYDDGSQPVIVAGDLNDERMAPPVRRVVHDLGYADVIERDWVGTYEPPYTYNRYPYHSRIDYLLLNGRAEAAYVADSAWVRAGKGAQDASDHYPVTIDLVL